MTQGDAKHGSLARRPPFLSALLLTILTTMQSANGADADLQAWIDERIAAGDDLAITAVVIDGDEQRHYAGGAVAPGGTAPGAETQFQVGSITKVFTDLLLAEAVAAGKVDYDTAIGAVLGPGFAPRNPAVAKITLEQLATHTSGLPRLPANLVPSDPADPYKGYDEAKLMEGITIARDKQPLGKHYAYSNFGVGLLGHLLGDVYGSSYRDALVQNVIAPLGLEQTGFDLDSNRAKGFRGGEVVPDWGLEDSLAGAGALWGSTADFARFAQVLLGRTPSRLEHDLAADLDVVVEGPWGFDLTRVWHVEYASGEPIYWHNGGTGGFWSFFGFRPDKGLAIALLVSGDTDPTAEGLQRLGRTPPDIEPADIDSELFGQYALTPQIGIGVFELDGQLVAQVTGQGPIPLMDIGDDWYAIDVVDASLHFTRTDGTVGGLELAQNGSVQPARKTADEAATATRTAVEFDELELADYPGEYRIDDDAAFTIRLGDGVLEARLTGQPFFPVYPAGDDVFFYKVVDAELRFERDAAGDVNALVLHQGPIVQRAEKR